MWFYLEIPAARPENFDVVPARIHVSNKNIRNLPVEKNYRRVSYPIGNNYGEGKLDLTSSSLLGLPSSWMPDIRT